MESVEVERVARCEACQLPERKAGADPRLVRLSSQIGLGSCLVAPVTATPQLLAGGAHAPRGPPLA
jgi:hypothetical protein